MIRLISLEFKDIGRFTDYQKIDFSKKGNLLQIDGKRLDYNGSSGAGKSTIIHINDMILGLKTRPLNVLQTRKSKNGYWAKGTYSCGANQVILTIERSKKDGLVIEGVCPFTNEQIKISGNNHIAEEYIDRLIGIPRDIFKKMVHKEQKSDGFVLNMPPGDMFKFLANVLGLSNWLEKLKKLDESLTSLENKNASLKDSLEKENERFVLAKQRKEQAEARTKPEKPVLNVDISILDSLKNSYNSIQNDKNKSISEIALPIVENVSLDISEQNLNKEKIKNEHFTLKNAKDQEISNLKADLKDIENKRKEHAEIEDKKTLAKNDILSKRREVKHIDDNMCPTCYQVWNTPSSQDRKKYLNEDISAIAKHFRHLSDLQPRLDVLAGREIFINEKINSLQEDIKKLAIKLKEDDEAINSEILQKRSMFAVIQDNANKRNAERKKEYQDKIASVSSSFDAKLSDIKNQIDNINAAQEFYKKEMDLYAKEIKMISDNLLFETNAYADARRAVENIEDSLKSIEKEIGLTEETKKIVKTFLFKAFDEALESIGQSATSYLSKIPNTSTCTVYFEPFKEVKGKIKEEVTCFISLDGDESIPVKSLSGGERSSIDLAIDFAAADFIQQKTGFGADFMFLDEPFEGLEPQTRVDYVELLRLISGDKRIVIVEHTTEVKEIVEDTITVVRDNEKSYIQ